MTHNAPPEDTECMVCFEELNEESYAEYQCHEGGEWKPSLICAGCIDILIDTQWKTYVDALANVKCKAEQRRLLDGGPPINVKDPHGMPVPNERTGKNDGEVYKLWYMHDNSEHDAKLKGSLVGKEKEEWWEYQKQFKFEEDDKDETPQTDQTS